MEKWELLIGGADVAREAFHASLPQFWILSSYKGYFLKDQSTSKGTAWTVLKYFQDISV